MGSEYAPDHTAMRVRLVAALIFMSLLLAGLALYFVMLKLAAHPGLRHDNVPVKIEAVSTGRLVSSGEQSLLVKLAVSPGRLVSSGEQSLLVKLPDDREVPLPFKGEVPERGERVAFYSIDLPPDGMARPHFPYSAANQATYSLTELTGGLNRGVWVLALIPALVLLGALGLLIRGAAALCSAPFSKRKSALTFADAYERPLPNWVRRYRNRFFSQEERADCYLPFQPRWFVEVAFMVAAAFLAVRFITPLKGGTEFVFYLAGTCLGICVVGAMFGVGRRFIDWLALWALARLSWGAASKVPADVTQFPDDLDDPSWGRWPLKWLKDSNWDEEVGLCLLGEFHGTLGELVMVSRSV